MTEKQLYRSESDKILGGVCGGLAEYLDQDPTIIRLLVFFIEIATAGSALLVYLVTWLIIPRESEIKGTEEETSEAEETETDKE